MNEVQIFNNEEFGSVRMIYEDGKVLFGASDTAKALGYKNITDAICRHCKGVVKRDTLTKGGKQKINFITEGDVYRLVAHSKLPSAERFESWVFDDVLPTLRKTGSYFMAETAKKIAEDPDYAIEYLAKNCLEKVREVRVLKKQIADEKPMTDIGRLITAAETDISVGAMAKILKQGGKDTGRKRFFAELREDGFIQKTKSESTLPTQRAMELGLFHVIEQTYYDTKHGETRINCKAMVTPKGQSYFIAKYL